MMSEMFPVDKDVTINWPTATVFVSIPLMIILFIAFWMFMSYDKEIKMKMIEAENERFKVLSAEMKNGCSNPNNEFSKILIVFANDQSWNCTPFFKPNKAPKVPDASKKKAMRG